MSLLDNIQDVAYLSAKPTDKIVAVFEGSFDVSSAPLTGGYLATHTFAHGFTRPVFTKMLHSSNGTTWQDGGGSSNAIAFSGTNNITIYTTRTSGTLFYKIIAFWIDDYDSTNPLVPPTVGSNSDVYFDSRLNYQKIAEQGFFTHSSSGITTVPHNLGYKPNTRIYIESLPNQIWPIHFGGAGNPWLYDFSMMQAVEEINSNNISIETIGGGRVFYTIYYDE